MGTDIVPTEKGDELNIQIKTVLIHILMGKENGNRLSER